LAGPLFLSSRQGGFLGSRHALRLLKGASDKIGLKINIGTHILRKTFGYFIYKKTGDVVKVMKMLNHSSLKDTMRYIALNKRSSMKLIWS
jgi:integrase